MLFYLVIFILYYLLTGKDKRHSPWLRGGASFFCMGSSGQSGRSGIFILFNYAVGIQMEGYMRRRRSTEQLFAGSILINIIVYVFFVIYRTTRGLYFGSAGRNRNLHLTGAFLSD